MRGEYIRRADAMGEITSSETQKALRAMTGEEAYVTVVGILNELPAADVAPVVHGLWMPVYESEMTGWNPAVAGRDPIGGYICSACKEEAVYDCNDKFVLSNYCPHCGAKMDGAT